jgi:hypothetical protein
MEHKTKTAHVITIAKHQIIEALGQKPQSMKK